MIGQSGGTRGVLKTGNAPLNFEGLNTYSGPTTITAGTLNVTNLANGGVPSGIGQSASDPANLVLAGGTFGFTGPTAATTDRRFTVGPGSGGLDASGVVTAAVTFSNPAPIVIAGSGPTSFRLTGSNFDLNTLASLVVDGASPTSLIKSGVGTWRLTGANTYTGSTTLDEGILTVASLANGGAASAIGRSPSNAENLVFSGGTLAYTGPAATTDRLLTIDAASGIIDASGTGALQFNNPGSVAMPGTGPRTLTLSGTNSGNNTFAPIIADSTDSTSLAKTGPGKWIVGSANSYTGPTDILEGTLVVPTAATLANSTVVTVFTDSTLDLSAIAGGFTVGPFKTMNANGAVNGSLTVQGALRGRGTVGPITISAGGIVAPEDADGVATLTAAAAALNGNGIYALDLRTDGAGGTAGTDWDRLQVSGAVDPTSLTSTSRFILKLQTLDAFGFPGPLASWNSATSHRWAGVIASGLGFTTAANPSLFNVDTSAFLNPIEGTFSVVQNGNALDLVYTIPEPSTGAVLFFGIGSLLLNIRTRRRSSVPNRRVA